MASSIVTKASWEIDQQKNRPEIRAVLDLKCRGEVYLAMVLEFGFYQINKFTSPPVPSGVLWLIICTSACAWLCCELWNCFITATAICVFTFSRAKVDSSTVMGWLDIA
jgi:hypothetical protein